MSVRQEKWKINPVGLKNYIKYNLVIFALVLTEKREVVQLFCHVGMIFA